SVPSDREAYAAAAGGHRVRVPDLEGLSHKVVHEVELGALHHFERDGIDEHGRPVAGGDEVVLGAGPLDVKGVLEARAAAALDGDAQRRAGLALEDRVEPPRRGGADRYGFRGRGRGFAHRATAFRCSRPKKRASSSLRDAKICSLQESATSGERWITDSREPTSPPMRPTRRVR